MRIIPISNPDDFQEVAQTMLLKALEDPKAAQLIEDLIKDSRADRRALFGTAFAMGAVSAMSAWMQGNLIQILDTVQNQGTS